MKIPEERCPWARHCQNGDEGCYSAEPEKCIRFMPTHDTNFIQIHGTVETQPEIDTDIFSQCFMNWINSMGWFFSGGIKPVENEENEMK